MSRASTSTLKDILVQFLAYQGGAVVWSPRVQGQVCSRPEGFPPSGSTRSEPDVHLSASSNLTNIINVVV